MFSTLFGVTRHLQEKETLKETLDTFILSHYSVPFLQSVLNVATKQTHTLIILLVLQLFVRESACIQSDTTMADTPRTVPWPASPQNDA